MLKNIYLHRCGFNNNLALNTHHICSYAQLTALNLKPLKSPVKSTPKISGFKPLFDHSPESLLAGLCEQFDDAYSYDIDPIAVDVHAIRQIHHNTETIADIIRAIKNHFVLACRYISLNSGESVRHIVPHALVYIANRWHIRAYDRKSCQFRDFVCQRFSQVEVKIEAAKCHEKSERDNQWHSQINLCLAPHPKLDNPLAIAMEYRMTDGQLPLNTRAALAGYLLRQWQVDCSQQQELESKQYPLTLVNPDALKGVSNAVLAPGYQV